MIGKRGFGLIVILLCSLFIVPLGHAEKLHSMVAYSLKNNVLPRLDKAENLIQSGDTHSAKSYLGSAQLQWQTIKKDFAGKYDTNHPDIVATQSRIDSITAKLTAAAKPATETAPAATATATSVPSALSTPPKAAMPAKTSTAASVSGQGEPSAMMRRSMDQVDAGLDGTLDIINAQNLKRATSSFKSDKIYMDALLSDFRGKYDQKHPDMVALTNKYIHVKAALDDLANQSAEATKNLSAVLSALTKSSDDLQQASDKASWGLRDLSSLISDEDTAKIHAQIQKILPDIERVYNLLPDAMASAKDFRKQYPDFGELSNLVKNGRVAGQKVEKLEKFPASWLDNSSWVIREALTEAQNNIQNYGLGKLGELEGSDESLKTHAANSAESLVIEFSSTLLDVIPVVYPELSAEVQALVPDIVKARKDAMVRVEQMRADIVKVTAAIQKIKKDVLDSEQRKIAQARFPKSQYHGGEWDEAENKIKKAWGDAIPDKSLLKIDIYRPWEVRDEARWIKDHWVINTYRYIGANCLAKLPGGKYRVYRMNYRNAQQDGGWSELKYWSVGHSYEILEENIDK